MLGFNKVILVGTVEDDLSFKETKSGDVILKFKLKTEEEFRKKNGEMHPTREYHSIIAFGAMAETMGGTLRKGDVIYLNGRVKYNTFVDDKGIKKYYTEIIAHDISPIAHLDSGRDAQQFADGYDFM